MKTIRLRFVTEAGLVSSAIRWWGSGLWSHVGAITDDGRYEVGARSGVDMSTTGKPGVQARPYLYAHYFTREETVEIPCTDTEHAKFWAALNREVGKPYSEIEILGDILGHDFRVRGAFVCSALMHYALTEARMTEPLERGRSRLITPDWLYGFSAGLRDGRVWGANDFGPKRRAEIRGKI